MEVMVFFNLVIDLIVRYLLKTSAKQVLGGRGRGY